MHDAPPTVFSSEALALDVAANALAFWPDLEGAQPVPVKVRENAVFRVRGRSGSDYVLRIHRPGYHSDAELDSEYIWTEALRDAGVFTPAQIRTHDGAKLALVSHEGTRYQVDLFAWVDAVRQSVALGGQGASPDEVADQYRAIGGAMGRMHGLSRSWTLPAGFTRHAWDADGLAGPDPFWGRFWELAELSPSQRETMLAVRDRLRIDLATLDRSSESYGLIHADLMPDNVIFAADGLNVIDFDDAGFGWYMFDVAVSLFSFSPRPDFAAVRDAFVEGYRAQRALSDDQLATLPMFLTARGSALLGWLHSRSQLEAASRAPWLIDIATHNADQWLQGR